MEPDREELERKLDEVVGERYDERGDAGLVRWIRASLGKWAAALALAVVAAVVVFRVLDRHMIAAHRKAEEAPRRPVVIDIVPPRPKPP